MCGQLRIEAVLRPATLWLARARVINATTPERAERLVLLRNKDIRKIRVQVLFLQLITEYSTV